MTIWYTADTHFGHENIMRFCNRPFVSASQMDAALLENMWKVVGPEDQLWVLGDFAFGSKAKDSAYVEQVFNQLPGAERHLVVGNHDHKPTLELPWNSVSHFAEPAHTRACQLCPAVLPTDAAVWRRHTAG